MRLRTCCCSPLWLFALIRQTFADEVEVDSEDGKHQSGFESRLSSGSGRHRTVVEADDSSPLAAKLSTWWDRWFCWNQLWELTRLMTPMKQMMALWWCWWSWLAGELVDGWYDPDFHLQDWNPNIRRSRAANLKRGIRSNVTLGDLSLDEHAPDETRIRTPTLTYPPWTRCYHSQTNVDMRKVEITRFVRVCSVLNTIQLTLPSVETVWQWTRTACRRSRCLQWNWSCWRSWPKDDVDVDVWFSRTCLAQHSNSQHADDKVKC